MPAWSLRSTRRVALSSLLAIASVLAGACGAGSSNPAEVTTGDVHGTLLNAYWDADGVRTTAVAPGAATVPPTIEVAALSPATGGYHRYPGTISASGSFTIPGVEPGSYLLEVRNQPTGVRYVELSARQVDLGLEIFSSTAGAAGPGTGYALAVDGLDTAAASSVVYAIVPGSTGGLAFLPAAAAPSMTGTLPLAGNPMPAPSAQGWAFQLVSGSPPGGIAGTYWTTTRAGTFSANAIDGATTPVSVTLSALSSTGSLSATWRTGDFEAFASQMAPSISSIGHGANVRAVPYGLAGAAGLSSPIVTLASLSVPAGVPSLSTNGVQWGRFLPAGWQEYVTTSFIVTTPFTAPGATVQAGLSTSISTTDQLSSATTLAPRTSPPRHPTVAGLDGLAPQAGVGATPRLAWNAPDMGDTGSYAVSLYALGVSGSSTRLTLVATFRVRGRHLDVPDGLLQAGTSYTAAISAIDTPTFDWSKPLHQKFPSATASVVLAAFTP